MYTTDFVKSEPYIVLDKCHGGTGSFKIKDLIQSVAPEGKQFIKFIHDDIIPPNSSFGCHKHDNNVPVEEWYFCISGKGIMYLDGKEYPMEAGDISVCRAHGEHGIFNNSNEDLRILVIFAAGLDF